MKASKREITRWKLRLQDVCDDVTATPIERRIAWLELHLLRRITEDTVGWPDPIADLKHTAALIERETAEGRIGEEV